MLDWLREKRQTETAIRRFWNQVLVSAVNEDLDRMAASHGFQVFWLGFLARANSYEMGIPAVPLGDLYGPEAWKRIANVRLHPRAPVERVIAEDGAIRGVMAGGERHTADYYISALPFERVPALIPELELNLEGFEHSPITGIHLWFDRSLTAVAARHAAGSDDTVDVQQIRRPVFATGGERVAEPGGDAARRSDRAGGARTGASFFRAPRRPKSKRRTW